jgi:hypothetical protein
MTTQLNVNGRCQLLCGRASDAAESVTAGKASIEPGEIASQTVDVLDDQMAPRIVHGHHPAGV